MPPELASLGWPALVVMGLGAIVIGFSKTSFAGLGAVSAALFALVLPAKESTAAVLLLLIVGDVVGVFLFGRHARWGLLWRLFPTVIPGLLLGAAFMKVVDDDLMRRTIGVLLLVTVALQFWQRRRPQDIPAPDRPHWALAGATGVAAGFTTMTANAAGPVMALYLLAARVDKARFIGTNAWFFGLVNVSKVPLTASLGLFTPQVLWVVAAMIPVVLLGTIFGRRVVRRVSQRQFETVTLTAALLSAVAVLLR